YQVLRTQAPFVFTILGQWDEIAAAFPGAPRRRRFLPRCGPHKLIMELTELILVRTSSFHVRRGEENNYELALCAGRSFDRARYRHSCFGHAGLSRSRWRSRVSGRRDDRTPAC